MEARLTLGTPCTAHCPTPQALSSICRAQEFLFALLGRVQEELLASAAGPLPPPPARPPPALLSRTGDPTARQLSGCILHDHKCNKCGGGPTIREQVTHLSVSPPNP